MFFIVPLQVEDAKVDRVPVVSIAIAGLCVLAFVAVNLAPATPSSQLEAEMDRVLLYYKDHPYLELPPAFTERFLSAEDRASVGRMRDAALERHLPGETQRAQEQAYLEGVAAQLASTMDSSPIRRFALVPARGVAQLGWLTHMFLHFGLMHLLGNLLFFYLTGPLLEDIWGRRFFALFYLACGLFAAVSHAALERGSAASMAGASGAIAGCMGAFTYRFGRRKIRMGYLVFLLFRFARGSFLLPAWLWGMFWFGSEIFSLETGGSAGVAVLAHIGGFAFGFGVALFLDMSGIGRYLIEPAVQGTLATSGGVRRKAREPATAAGRARAALAAGDSTGTAQTYRNALVANPLDHEATVGLARLELDQGEGARAMGRVDRLAREALRAGQADEAWRALLELGPRAEPSRLTPQTARGLLEARAHAPPSASAIVAALEKLVPSAAPAPADGTVVTAGVRVIACRLQSLDALTVTLEVAGGQVRAIPLAKLQGVGSSILPPPGGAAGGIVFTDLVLRFGSPQGPATVARISAPALGLSALFPGVAPREAYRRLLEKLLAAPHVAALPDREALEAGRFPSFADEAALSAAFYPAA